MSKNIVKFGPQDNIKFIEIYRNYECLWNQQNPQYKNRDARDAALKSFAAELAIDNFGPKEIVIKIKNMRSQYLQEMKKIKSSIGTGVSVDDIYTPKLPWFSLMDSFMRTVIETRPAVSNLSVLVQESQTNTLGEGPEGTLDDTQRTKSNITVDDTRMNQSSVESTQEFLPPEKPITRKRKNIKPVNDYISVALNKLDDIEKRASSQDDDLSAFGNYVVSTLRKFSARNCMEAQDEIYATLSKYKLRQLVDSEATSSFSGSPTPHSTSTPMPESPFSKDENNDKFR